MIAKHTVQCVNKVAAYLNGLAEDKARSALAKCCGAQRWVDELLAARPFTSDAARDAGRRAPAGRAWWAVGREGWRGAFQGHPRIGERTAEEWSRREQAGVDTAAAATRAALARENVAYIERFGYLFLTCATGKTAGELLGELRRRLGNDPATELRIAAGEQAKITRLRLEKLVAP